MAISIKGYIRMGYYVLASVLCLVQVGNGSALLAKLNDSLESSLAAFIANQLLYYLIALSWVALPIHAFFVIGYHCGLAWADTLWIEFTNALYFGLTNVVMAAVIGGTIYFAGLGKGIAFTAGIKVAQLEAFVAIALVQGVLALGYLGYLIYLKTSKAGMEGWSSHVAE